LFSGLRKFFQNLNFPHFAISGAHICAMSAASAKNVCYERQISKKIFTFFKIGIFEKENIYSGSEFFAEHDAAIYFSPSSIFVELTNFRDSENFLLFSSSPYFSELKYIFLFILRSILKNR